MAYAFVTKSTFNEKVNKGRNLNAKMIRTLVTIFMSINEKLTFSSSQIFLNSVKSNESTLKQLLITSSTLKEIYNAYTTIFTRNTDKLVQLGKL